MSKKKNKVFKKSDIFYHIVKGWRVIIVFTLVGLVLGVSIIGFGYVRGEMTREYRITSSVAVVAVNSLGRYSANSKEPLKSDIDFARSFTESAMYIIKSQRNMEAVVDELGLQGVSAGDISRNLSVSRYGDTEIIELTLLWRTEKEGLQIMDAITKVSHRTMIDTEKIGGVAVINEPKANFIVGGNISLSTWIYAAVAGFIAGIVFCILRFLLATTVINEIDLEEVFSLDSLGSVPLDVNYARAKPLSEEAQAVQDDIKSVTHLLINRLEIAKANKLYITSTEPKEGKTRLLADIALQFSNLGKRTLLIDCNFKNPMLGALFSEELSYTQSLNALYRGEVDRIDAIVHINGCLDLLPAVLEEEPESINDAMLGQIAKVMDGYDYVMIDAAPVGVEAEVLRLNEIVDTAIYVIKCDSTKVEDIKNALFRISKSGIPVAGGIFNCVVNWRQTLFNTPRRLTASLQREAKKRSSAMKKAKKEAERAQMKARLEEEREGAKEPDLSAETASVEKQTVSEKKDRKTRKAEEKAEKFAQKEALKAQKEAKKAAEKEAREKAEKEAREKAEKEAREKAEMEAKKQAEKEAGLKNKKQTNKKANGKKTEKKPKKKSKK